MNKVFKKKKKKNKRKKREKKKTGELKNLKTENIGYNTNFFFFFFDKFKSTLF